MRRFLLLSFLLFSATVVAEPFTYQGQLSDGGSLANGDYDFVFKLYDGSDPNTAVQQGNTVTVNDLPVSSGVFTATIDPGILFDGTPLWLEVSVRPGASTGSYTQLLPLQVITAAPEAQVSLSVVANSIGNSQIVDGSVTNADLAGGIDPAKITGTAWTQAGNSPATGAYLGTNNSEPLVFKVNGRQVGVLTDAEDSTGSTPYHAPNVLLGSENNTIATGVIGGSIGGGGGDPTDTTCVDGSQPCVNTVSSDYGTVAGGWGNYASGSAAVGGGRFNTASGIDATVGGGNSTPTSGFGSPRANASRSRIPP